MIKPDNYDSVNLGSQRLPVGGYICTIMNVKEDKTKNGKNMIIISLDIAEGEYKNHYRKQFTAKNDKNAKWGCVVYAVAEGEYIQNFVAFCKYSEESNNCTIAWGDNFGSQFKGKKIGCVFGEEEFNGQNGIAISTKPRYFLPVKDIRDGKFTIPKKKALTNSNSVNNIESSGFVEMDASDEDLPF